MTCPSSAVGVEARRKTTAGRMYEIEGELYPSVTTVLQTLNKPALLNWIAKEERTHVLEQAGKVYEPGLTRADFLLKLEGSLDTKKRADRTVERALEIGTQAHRWIEWETHRRMGQAVGPAPEVSTPAMTACGAWADWFTAHRVRPVLVEQVVYSRFHGYAGTCDLVAEIDGVLTLVDYKTSGGGRCYPEAHLQSAAYQAALAEMGHGDCARGLVVVLPKLPGDPTFTVHEVGPRAHLLPVFVHLLEVWRWQQEVRG